MEQPLTTRGCAYKRVVKNGLSVFREKNRFIEIDKMSSNDLKKSFQHSKLIGWIWIMLVSWKPWRKPGILICIKRFIIRNSHSAHRFKIMHLLSTCTFFPQHLKKKTSDLEILAFSECMHCQSKHLKRILIDWPQWLYSTFGFHKQT